MHQRAESVEKNVLKVSITKRLNKSIMEKRNYSVIYRLMHWSIAFCMLFILFTVFLRMTWMNKENVANIMQKYFAETNASMTREQLIDLAKQIRKPMWVWHNYAGYVLSALFFLRLTLPFFGELKFANPFNKQLALKVKFQYWVYLVFYVCVLLSLVTGLTIEFGPSSMKSTVEEIHVLSIYYLLTFLVLHVGGILIAEFTVNPGIISRIVRGTKG
ncbi:MAG: hypothetical protein RL265_101 [Bacteroidota bacterium]